MLSIILKKKPQFEALRNYLDSQHCLQLIRYLEGNDFFSVVFLREVRENACCLCLFFQILKLHDIFYIVYAMQSFINLSTVSSE